MSTSEVDAAATDREMDRFVDISLELAGFDPVLETQREGIKKYYSFAKAMMAPLLGFDIPGEDA